MGAGDGEVLGVDSSAQRPPGPHSGTSAQTLLDHHVALSAPGMCDDLSVHSPQVLHPTPPAPELLSAVTHGNEWNIPLTVGAALWEL